jgi:hypothetical protein
MIDLSDGTDRMCDPDVALALIYSRDACTITVTLMEPGNTGDTGPSKQRKNSKKPKGTHGGARPGSGRPRKTVTRKALRFISF